MVAALPSVLGFSIEEYLRPKVQWLEDLGLKQHQVVKTVSRFPALLSYSIERNLDLKLAWFLDLGLSKFQIAKMIVAYPSLLSLSLEDNLKRKAQWFMDLGLSQDEVAEVIVVFPPFLAYSVDKNLEPKRVLLQKVLGTVGAAEEVRKMPQFFGCSYQCLSSRSKILVGRNETQKLRYAMKMTEDCFSAKCSHSKHQ